ncbi:hypothetical protein V6N13_134168 [Hibiscus sabdariffa]|uniref:Uncharacterized protein n=2 Tax=Hibiscus sabdariffa TaxID=183260 RepID=A0ABR2ASZ6_9ROSI
MIISEVEGVGYSLADVAQGGEALGDALWIDNLILEAVQGKIWREGPRKNTVARGPVNDPLSDSEIALAREARATLEVGKWVGISTIRKEEDIISNIVKILKGIGIDC